VLLVIFGAGASYDSFGDYSESDSEKRPPLADELFGKRQAFRTELQFFPECQALATRLSDPNPPLEHQLEVLQAQTGINPIRKQQLAGIRFYIRNVIWKTELRWHRVHKGVTNYKTLLDDLEHWRIQNKEEICIVTFNYDKMLETALADIGITIKSFDDYISDPRYKVIKVHGSVDWAFITNATNDPENNQGDEITRQMRLKPPDTFTSPKEFRLIENSGVTTIRIGKWATAGLFPAIAIPVTSKMSFECPDSHSQALSEALPKVNRILTVGWRGTENYFLKLLREKLSPGMPKQVIVVAGSLTEANKVENNMKEGGIGGIYNNANDGFTRSLRERVIDHYLSQNYM
jgi:hypothetical protein